MSAGLPDERALTFDCAGDTLVGVLSSPAGHGPRGVLIVVGGPQYRAGSHRQFTLLARSLAARGIASLRFDYRGMGDSDGAARGFEDVGEDLSAAIDAFMGALPDLTQVVVWGLCDAASAALLHAHRDPRVHGLVLLNPWVRSEAGIARTYLKHYYLERLTDRAFWGKVLGGGFDWKASARSLAGMARDALGRSKAAAVQWEVDGTLGAAAAPAPGDFVAGMRDGFERFAGPVLLILSGDDFTAQEFKDLTAADPSWRRLVEAPRVSRRDLAEANHTFSSHAWREQVADWTADWTLAP